jgi:hypothetical protein
MKDGNTLRTAGELTRLTHPTKYTIYKAEKNGNITLHKQTNNNSFKAYIHTLFRQLPLNA